MHLLVIVVGDVVDEQLKPYQENNCGTCPEDRRANDDALETGGRLLSVYRARGSGEAFFVITEADRSATTLLLPAEY